MSDQPPEGPGPEEGVGSPQPVQQVEDSQVMIDLDAPDSALAGTEGPPELEASSIVPRFRRDLSLKKGEQGGVFDVHDPKSGKTFSLYEFEISISRMLDGRRRVSDLLQDGARLGIPVDLEGLRKFVRQLYRYGFLAAPGEDELAGEGSAWEERESWDDSTRTLFQSGIRMMRMGRPVDARGYFEAILDSYPDHPESTEMIALVDSGLSLQAAPIGSTVAHGHGALPPAAFGAGGISPLSQGGRSFWPLAAMGSVVVIGAVAITYIIVTQMGSSGAKPTESTEAAEVAVAPTTPSQPSLPLAPEAGAEIPPVVGAAAPTPEAATEVAVEPPVAEQRNGTVEERSRPVLAKVVSRGSGSIAWKARSGRKVRKGRLIATIRGGKRPNPRRVAAEKKVAELEQMAKKDPVYQDFLAKARKERDRLPKTRRGNMKIRAPATGTLELVERKGRKVKRDALLARIVSPKGWWIHGEITGEMPVADEVCEVLDSNSDNRAAGKVVEVEAGDESHGVVISVPGGPATRWVGRAKAGALRLEMGP